MLSRIVLSICLMGLWFSNTLAESTVLKSGVESTPLVELFTSEGCRDCRSADRWLGELVDDPQLWKQIIPIAFHVDYWNYLGWRDRFSTKAFSIRQHTYASYGHLSQVYTPGFVVNGKEWRGWFRQPVLNLTPPPSPVGILHIEAEEEAFTARFSAVKFRLRQPRLNIALLGFGLSTPVKAGENRGQTLKHEFVVLGHKDQPMFIDNQTLKAKGTLPEPSTTAPRYGLVAWVNNGSDPRPLQAVGGWFNR